MPESGPPSLVARSTLLLFVVLYLAFSLAGWFDVERRFLTSALLALLIPVAVIAHHWYRLMPFHPASRVSPLDDEIVSREDADRIDLAHFVTAVYGYGESGAKNKWESGDRHPSRRAYDTEDWQDKLRRPLIAVGRASIDERNFTIWRNENHGPALVHAVLSDLNLLDYRRFLEPAFQEDPHE